ncbi:hypothetical protein A2U01_0032494 [Trifolium medium]|uniref:Uncharacterized protein n=1 Tax=Trifolium medium TaxID=97028 RepID=A0A392PHW8_9FABA|nr:hypothetical protein [Trifolium medium]
MVNEEGTVVYLKLAQTTIVEDELEVKRKRGKEEGNLWISDSTGEYGLD